MINYLPNRTYSSPLPFKKRLGYYFCLGTRIYFYSRIFFIVWKGNRVARAGKFTLNEFNELSWMTLKSVEACGGKIIIEGLENIDKIPKPFVLIGNHMSTLETMGIPCMLLPRIPFVFVIKDSLLKYPLFGKIMQSLPNIPLGRQRPREDLKLILEKGSEFLKKGISVIVFPQSTRNENFLAEEFNSIGIKLAKRASVPVLPLALKTDFWGNGKIFKELGPVRPDLRVHFHFGEPIFISRNGKDEHKKIINFIQSKLREWENEKNHTL